MNKLFLALTAFFFVNFSVSLAQEKFENKATTSFVENFEYPLPVLEIEQDAFVVSKGKAIISSIDSLRFILTLDDKMLSTSPSSRFEIGNLDTGIHRIKIVFFDQGYAPLEFDYKAYDRFNNAIAITDFHIFSFSQKNCLGIAPVSKKLIKNQSKIKDVRVDIPGSNKKKPSFKWVQKPTGVSIWATFTKYPDISTYQVPKANLSTVVMNCVVTDLTAPPSDVCDQKPMNCKLSDNEERFKSILNSIAELRSDQRKEEEVMEQKKYYCMSTLEISKIINNFSEDEVKVKIAKSLFNNCTDKKNFNSLASSLDNKHAAALLTFLSSRCPKNFPIGQ